MWPISVCGGVITKPVHRLAFIVWTALGIQLMSETDIAVGLSPYRAGVSLACMLVIAWGVLSGETIGINTPGPLR